MWVAISLGMALLVVSYALVPLMAAAVGQDEVIDSAQLTGLQDSKERSLRAIKDLELDFAMGKLSQEDFETTKAALALEASSILQELKRHESR